MKMYPYWPIIGIMIILLGLIGTTGTRINADEINPGVAPLGEKHYGLTYEDWGVKWWQWALELPADKNPLSDTTGERCGNGQGGPVWFLGASWTYSKIIRNCTIPSGVAIFFPLANGECSTVENKYKTYAELRECVIESNSEDTTNMEAWIDGKELKDPKKYLVESPPFNFTLPKNHVLGDLKEGTTPAYAVGWFIMLEPLSKGAHNIHFTTSTYSDMPNTPQFPYVADVTYNLMIE